MLCRVVRAWPRLVAGTILLALFLGLGWATGITGDVIDEEALSRPGGGVFFAIALAVVSFGIVAIAVVLFAVLAPGLLNMIELLPIALILSIPVTLLRQPIGLPGWIDWAAMLALYVAAHKVLYGPWLASLGRKDTRTRRLAFEVAEPVETVWARLVPLPENAGTYYWPQADFLAPPEGSEADFVLHAPRRDGLPPSIDAYHVERLDPGCAITFASAPLPGPYGIKERQSLRLTPADPGTRVELAVTFLDVPIAHRIRLWLGNDARDFAASLKNRARGRRDNTIHGRQVLPA